MNGARDRIARFLRCSAFALSVATLAATAWSEVQAGTPTYRIDFFTISNGGNALLGSCFHLSATVGQIAPGYSSASLYSLIAGYWQPAPVAATDEIFFNGFQAC